jgi:hypothetical protein
MKKAPDSPKFSFDALKFPSLSAYQQTILLEELAFWQAEVREELFNLLKSMKDGTMDNASTIQALELLEKLTRK